MISADLMILVSCEHFLHYTGGNLKVFVNQHWDTGGDRRSCKKKKKFLKKSETNTAGENSDSYKKIAAIIAGMRCDIRFLLPLFFFFFFFSLGSLSSVSILR